MCTLVVSAQPLIVVANRDESLGRPSRPPFQWDEGFLAPRDELAGGTWLGVNPHGVFVGITNRYQAMLDAKRASRGELVVRALGLTSARAIHDAMRAIEPKAYNGFHLVYADERDVLATAADGITLAQFTLGSGVVAITERSFGAGDDSKRIARIMKRWDRDPAKLSTLLAEHDEEDPLSATCVHAPSVDYGTRSAMILTREHGAWKMSWADGPPCTTPFRPVP